MKVDYQVLLYLLYPGYYPLDMGIRFDPDPFTPPSGGWEVRYRQVVLEEDLAG
jgi:hypothetical protein